MTLKVCCRVLLLLPVLVLGSPVQADQITLTANLIRDEEPPPPVGSGGLTPTTTTGAPRPVAFGTATFVLDTAVPFMTMSVTVTHIDITGSQTADSNDNLVAAHIHAGPPGTAIPGVNNAPVRWGFFGSPDNDVGDPVITLAALGAGGTFEATWDSTEGNNGPTTLADQMANILAGRSYINFHTVQFGGGEIRGQLLVVPEPGTFALLGLGLVGLAGLRRKSA